MYAVYLGDHCLDVTMYSIANEKHWRESETAIARVQHLRSLALADHTHIHDS